jgi:hypothetical protein
MRRLALLLITTLCLLGVATPAGAAEITQAEYRGCNSGSWHYRLTQFHWQESDGSRFKTWYLDVINPYTGAMAHQNAWHAWSEYLVFADTVYHQDGHCHFRLAPWPGYPDRQGASFGNLHFRNPDRIQGRCSVCELDRIAGGWTNHSSAVVVTNDAVDRPILVGL